MDVDVPDLLPCGCFLSLRRLCFNLERQMRREIKGGNDKAARRKEHELMDT